MACISRAMSREVNTINTSSQESRRISHTQEKRYSTCSLYSLPGGIDLASVHENGVLGLASLPECTQNADPPHAHMWAMRRVNLLVHDRCITMRTGCSQFQRTSLDRVKITWSLSREKAGGRYDCIGLTRLMCCIKATTSAILWPEHGRVVSRKALGGSFLAIVVAGKPSFPKGVTRTSQPTGRQRVDVVMAERLGAQ